MTGARMEIAVVSIFPEMFGALTDYGIAGRAIESGLVKFHAVNPRDCTADRARRVDDRPYGGGAGMVMLFEPMRDAVRSARSRLGEDAHVVYLSPQGRRLDQAGVRELGRRERLILVCGRYEGVDERLIESEVDEELSLGDYLLSGGELAAMVVVEALIRCLPGALGHEDSAGEESFERGLLEHPHYTRPRECDGRRVPDVLLGGDHDAIRRWRLKQALGRTWLRRPDLLNEHRLNAEKRTLLDEFKTENASSMRPATINTASTFP